MSAALEGGGADIAYVVQTPEQVVNRQFQMLLQDLELNYIPVPEALLRLETYQELLGELTPLDGPELDYT